MLLAGLAIARGLAAGTCSLPPEALRQVVAVRGAAGSVALSWEATDAEGFAVWRATARETIPRAAALAADPAVTAVPGCRDGAGLDCRDPAPPAAVVTFYQVRPLCCGSEGYDPEAAAMVAAIESERIAADIATLVAFGTRNSCSEASGTTPGIGAARDWLRARFAAIPGIEVALHPFALAGCALPATAHNVVARIPGTARPEHVIVVGGHYDSRSLLRGDGTSPAPGANDSGSQTALLLELARVMAPYPAPSTIAFVAFAGEEQGLLGSAAFVRDRAQLFPGATIDAMLNCDIVGGDSSVNDEAALRQFRLYAAGTPREVHGGDGSADDSSPARALMRHVAAWGLPQVPGTTLLPRLREDRPGRGGDHQPFLDAAIPAVRFIETNESLQHQHGPGDVAEHVTPAYVARVAGIVAGTVTSLSRAPGAPQSLLVARTGPGQLQITWVGPPGPGPTGQSVTVRAANEPLRVRHFALPDGRSQVTLGDAELGLVAGEPFYLSVVAIGPGGHASLPAFPEYRCDAQACGIPAGSYDVTGRD